ncbi:MAG: hypothetical protein GY847_27925 [Proteobacteria bacterium]|nr:hypothetical protein [Pseudomonadota bacterium]
MAKPNKKTRDATRAKRGGGSEFQLPQGVHSLDSHGNIFASLPEISRVVPRYFTLEEIKEAFQTERLKSLSEDDVKQLEGLATRK